MNFFVSSRKFHVTIFEAFYLPMNASGYGQKCRTSLGFSVLVFFKCTSTGNHHHISYIGSTWWLVGVKMSFSSSYRIKTTISYYKFTDVDFFWRFFVFVVVIKKGNNNNRIPFNLKKKITHIFENTSPNHHSRFNANQPDKKMRHHHHHHYGHHQCESYESPTCPVNVK